MGGIREVARRLRGDGVRRFARERGQESSSPLAKRVVVVILAISSAQELCIESVFSFRRRQCKEKERFGYPLDLGRVTFEYPSVGGSVGVGPFPGAGTSLMTKKSTLRYLGTYLLRSYVKGRIAYACHELSVLEHG